MLNKLLVSLLICLGILQTSYAIDEAEFDLVLLNARVMDPRIQTRRNSIDRHSWKEHRVNFIGAIAWQKCNRCKRDDCCSGFIDLHSHGQTDENYRYKAMDGVTTALELEVGVSPVAQWYAEREGKALVNFGASAGHIPCNHESNERFGKFLAAR